MIIYNPKNRDMLGKRIKKIEEIFNNLKTKHCFITGSFLYMEKYRDIDLFMISRTKKKIVLGEKINIMTIDFNQLYSLFYHSISKSCVSKALLPKRQLKVTLKEYWDVINETVPSILNNKDDFKKDIRSLVLYTEFFTNATILDSYELSKKIEEFKDYKQVIAYLEKIPFIMKKHLKLSYIKKYFYTQAAYYSESKEYSSQKYLYNLSHEIIKEAAND